MLYSAFIVDPLIHPVPKLNTNLSIKEFIEKKILVYSENVP